MSRPFTKTLFIVVGALLIAIGLSPTVRAADFSITIRQITTGPSNHFFGYIGHVQNIPWNGNGRYILALRTSFQDRMPGPKDAADVVLIDTRDDYAVRVVDQSRGWNPQQGTMFYWNPAAPDTQFFFNDRDPQTGKVFCVLFDVTKGKAGGRLREYRDEKTPVGNSGVAQNGGRFLAINYARMARLRPVTGYKGTFDWTVGIAHPKNDGIFKIDVNSGKKSLLVSFHQLAKVLQDKMPRVEIPPLFINHTLWNREDDRIFFFARAGWNGDGPKTNQPFVIRPDGTHLTPLKQHIGGHPEWDFNHRMIGRLGDRQIIYDTNRQRVVGSLGLPGVFPNPEGDIALSQDGKWFVNGYKDKRAKKNFYVIYRCRDGAHLRSPGFDIGRWTSGDLRQDPSPCWNRDGTQILVPGLAGENGRRQLFIIEIRP
jgi:hypothetical protein